LKVFGYARDGKLHVYWLYPGKDINDGLVPIENDADIVKMINAIRLDKTRLLYIDHTNFLKNLIPDILEQMSK
jgi:hypothetical protein